MASIEVDFDVFKALTARRASESVTYNDVIREILRLGENETAGPRSSNDVAFTGLILKGVEFPNGTKFRATHKGRTHTGSVRNGVWVDEKGNIQSSPSAAAWNAAGTTSNGWWFWECSRPSDPSWIVIGNLRK